MSPSLEAEGSSPRLLTADLCSAELERIAAHEQLQAASDESGRVVERAQERADEIRREAEAARAARLAIAETTRASTLDRARVAADAVLAQARAAANAAEVDGRRAVAEREAAVAAAARLLSETRDQIAHDTQARRAAHAHERADALARLEELARVVRHAGEADALASTLDLLGDLDQRAPLDRPTSQPAARRTDRDAAAPVGTKAVEPAAAPARHRLLVPLFLAAVGLSIQVVGYARGWSGHTGHAIAFWYAGLVLVAGAFSWAALRRDLTDRSRLLMAVCFGHFVYLSWLLSDPVMATRFDETLHVKTLLDLTSRAGFFQPHDLLPVSPFFPGLELATAGIRWLTGLPLMACQVLVVMIARTVLVVGLFWATRRVTRSAAAASIAVVLYGASPQFYFFNSQFSYQTVALAMLVAVMVLLLRSSDDEARWPWRHLLPGMACAAALAITHHLTSWLTLITLIGLAALFALGKDRRKLRLTATTGGLFAVVVVLWGILVGPMLVSYLLPIFENATSDVIAVFAGDGAQHAPGAGTGGVPTPLWEMGVMAASILGWLTLLGPACWWAWRRGSLGGSIGRYLPLLLAASYPGLNLMRFSEKAAEVGDRISTFLFLALAAVVGAWLARTLAAAPWFRVVALPGLVLLIVGGTVLGSGPGWSRTTGPFLPAAEQRSVDAESIAVARWLAERIPAGSHVAADNTFNRLLPIYAPVRMTTGPGDFRGVAEVYLSDKLGPWEMGILLDDGVDFLIADYRQADTRPYSGSLFEGSSGYGERGSRLSSTQLDKFAEQPSFDLILDGPVKVYDLRGLRGEKKTFVHRDVPPVPGGLPWRQATVVAGLGLLVGALFLARRRRPTVTLTGLFLTLPLLMLVGVVGVVTGMSAIAGVLVAAAGLVLLVVRAPSAELSRRRWRWRDRFLLAATALVLAACLLTAGWAAGHALFDTPVTLKPVALPPAGETR